MITSPHDIEARFGKKQSTTWMGYKVQLTETCNDGGPPETCNDGGPHLILNATTRPAPAPDGQVTLEAQGSLRDRSLMPGKRMVGTGFIDADLLLAMRREHGVDLS